MSAWQKEWNTFQAVKGPTPQELVSLNQSYSWGSQIGQTVEQSVSGQVIIPNNGIPEIVLTFKPQYPIRVKAITITIGSDSNFSGVGIFIDISPQAWSNAYAPPNAIIAPNIFSPGSILEGAGATAGTYTQATLTTMNIVGKYDGGTVTTISVQPIVQQSFVVIGYVGVGAAGGVSIGVSAAYGMVQS